MLQTSFFLYGVSNPSSASHTKFNQGKKIGNHTYARSHPTPYSKNSLKDLPIAYARISADAQCLYDAGWQSED